MRLVMSSVDRFLFTGAVLIISLMGLVQAQTVIAPVEDVFFYTFGGGEGCNTYLKYDITAVPSGEIIDSVYLTPFVYQINNAWNGNMNFWNVNDQNWTESDSCGLLWSLPTSDSTYQVSGFGTSMGWTQSVSLTNIFLTDYNAGHTYCSIKMKDPDDLTNVPTPGSYPYDYDDSLMVGNRLIPAVGYIVFFPHEWPNGPPWLLIYHHEVGTDEDEGKMIKPLLRVHPNPCTEMTNIKWRGIDNRSQMIDYRMRLAIYDAMGKLVKEFNCLTNRPFNQITWRGDNSIGQPVSAGVYFCKLETADCVVIGKICLIK